jgi:hypothetical protein
MFYQNIDFRNLGNSQESAKRAVRQLKQKNHPVSIEMLLELCNMHLGNNNLLVVRDLTMILLSFAGIKV